MLHRRRFRAMGTHAEIVVGEPDRHLVDAAVARIAELDAKWSRFRPDSELSALNTHPGTPVLVSPETAALVAAAKAAWDATNGLFDPTVHDTMHAIGYDRSFEHVQPARPAAPVRPPGPAGVEVDLVLSMVVVPTGVRLDLGGIGKGTAADLVSAELVAAGAAGVCCSVGGDLRVRGTSPAGGGWTVTIEGTPLPALDDGGVATSSTRRRRWSGTDGTPLHHIIDPRVGLPAAGGLDAVTVVAATAQQAEVLAKACLIAGPAGAPSLLSPGGPMAVLVGDEYGVRRIGGLPGVATEQHVPA